MVLSLVMKKPLVELVDPVELGNATKEQQQLGIIILLEEAESFSKDGEDVRSIKGPQMNLTLPDQFRRLKLLRLAHCTLK